MVPQKNKPYSTRIRDNTNDLTYIGDLESGSLKK